jgi:Amt family ammonium transporter
VTVWSFGISYLLGKIIDLTIGFRADTEAEVAGIDVAEHAESAYDFAPAGGSSAFALAGVGTPAPAPAEKPVSEKVAG